MDSLVLDLPAVTLQAGPGGMLVPRAVPTPDRVRELEAELMKLPQVQLLTEMFAHGRMACRTIFIPAGVLLTGAETNCDNLCIMSGDITVTTDDGPQRLTGFHVIPARAGAKRVGRANADTWWTTIWHTDLTDCTEIENEMTDEADKLQTRRALGNDDRMILENQ